MTKPSTIAAIAVLVCTPALVSFASGEMSGVSLGICYLVALGVVAAGMHLLQWLIVSYGRPDSDKDGVAEKGGQGAG